MSTPHRYHALNAGWKTLWVMLAIVLVALMGVAICGCGDDKILVQPGLIFVEGKWINMIVEECQETPGGNWGFPCHSETGWCCGWQSDEKWLGVPYCEIHVCERLSCARHEIAHCICADDDHRHECMRYHSGEGWQNPDWPE